MNMTYNERREFGLPVEEDSIEILKQREHDKYYGKPKRDSKRRTNFTPKKKKRK